MNAAITALTNHPHWLREAIAFVGGGTCFVFVLAFFAGFGG